MHNVHIKQNAKQKYQYYVLSLVLMFTCMADAYAFIEML